MNVIEIEGLTKTFTGGKLALDDISLQVAAGEMVALIGASGSGKSTLIRHIAGLVLGDAGAAGAIRVHDRVVQTHGRAARDVRAIRREIGVIFQQFNLVGRMSVLTNVLTGVLGRIPVWRGTLGLFPLAEQQAAMRALDRVGIAETARQRASTLSGGQQQRAAIARAVLQGARVLLADEPIASLDPASARRVMENLETINVQDGIAIVVALHQVEYARRFCRRVIAMQDGRIVYDGPSSELSNERLRQIYGSASEELILPDADEVRRPAPVRGRLAAAAA
ncbi:MAG: phosphonate ABC transporter ATP-binding protein [Pseudomonadota bacterium]|nr:phosphonate ABC transporter ATP-binding protein [Pseudomonadota bacterium]